MSLNLYMGEGQNVAVLMVQSEMTFTSQIHKQKLQLYFYFDNKIKDELGNGRCVPGLFVTRDLKL